MVKGRWRDLTGISGFARSATRASCEGGGSSHAGEEDPGDDRYAFFHYLCCAGVGGSRDLQAVFLKGCFNLQLMRRVPSWVPAFLHYCLFSFPELRCWLTSMSWWWKVSPVVAVSPSW